MFLHGNSDVLVLICSKDLIEAKKLMNCYKKLFEKNIKEIYLIDLIATFRNNGIANPKIVEECTNLLI